MGKTKHFGIDADVEILKKFREAVNKNYHRGKMKEVIESLMEKYINEENKK